MIDHRDLHKVGVELIAPVDASEASMRRGVSTLYYGLFHRLAYDGAVAFIAGGEPLVFQAARAFSHTTMRKTCEAYAKSLKKPLQPPLDALASGPPDPRLVKVAEAFNTLQEARHRADYELSATLQRSEALELLERGEFAHWMLDEIAGYPETIIFLTALLLSDRWTRRG